MAEVTIVFIPEEDDIVWRISSEKVPHMTFLFLGEISDPSVIDNIVAYVEHTNEMSLHRFGMGVDRRGVLGDNEADVLFFEDEWNKDWLDDVRSHLLQNPNIKLAFDSAPQFDNWVPHLTLGMPETPAKKDTRENPGIHWVQFDKIAVWTGDSTGPEFILKRQDLSMSEKVQEFLSHHGVKGMKWGVRRAQRKAARKDKKWQKNIYTVKGAIAVHNHVAQHMNSKLPDLNARHPKANVNESVQSKATRAYIREYESMANAGYTNAVKAVHGTSPSGRFTARYDAAEHKIVIDETSVQHAEDTSPRLELEVEVDSTGHIVQFLEVRDEMAQSEEVLEFLSHHGVKGMKWGVRKRSGGKSSSTARTTFKKPPRKLSNEELQRRIKRMETERKYNSLNAGDKSKGRAFVEEVLSNSGRKVAKGVVTAAGFVAVKTLLESRIGNETLATVAKRL